MLERLRRLLAYNDWANREVVAALRAEEPESVRLMAHVIGAEHLWLARLERRPSPLAVWPELDRNACAAAIREIDSLWSAYLDRLTESDLAESIDYVNSKGEPWSGRVEDVLMHVVFHSGYHRAQIAAVIRRAGRTPPYTDFIHCIRQGFVE